MSKHKPSNRVSDRSGVREDAFTYGDTPRKRGRPRTLDYSVFGTLDTEPMALVQAVLRPPKGKRKI